jgi:hypothetical protein
MTSNAVSKFENVIRGMHGGGSVNRPTGGFLPIIECVNADSIVEDNKNREFTSKKSAVPIAEIMKKRRNTQEPLVL